jgi:tRNA(Ile)-lysidine synthase
MLDGIRHVTAGVSGGADSVCMLHMLARLRTEKRFDLTVVHIHHGIRGKEADEDMAYVENCCRKWEVEVRSFCYPVEKLAEEWRMSDEEAGRKVRYDTFRQVLQEQGGGKIAVAHNRDDSSETFLLNLFRGSGLQGLTGIHPVRGDIIRPVLCLDRKEILEYLEEEGIDYRTDSTNGEDVYTRNKIRNRIFPFVHEQINSRASEHIFRTAETLRETWEYLQEQAEYAYRDIVMHEGDNICMDAEKLKTVPKIIRTRIYRKGIEELAGCLKDITAEHMESMDQILRGETGKRISLPYHLIFEKKYGVICLYDTNIVKCRFTDKRQKKTQGYCVECHITEEEGEKMIYLPEKKGKISLRVEKNRIRNWKNDEKMYTKCLKCDILIGTFEVRTRRMGDYIVVNRQGGRKKLKDYFIDQKIPREKRDEVLLLAKGSEVFWIIGYRLSERCKVSEDTEKVLEISYFPEEV